MNTLRTTTIALAMAASATVAHGAVASWNYDGTDALQNSWGNAGSWTEAPAWDGNDVLTLDAGVISANRTLTLDGNRAIDTLSVYTTASDAASNRTYFITPGSGGTLTLKNLAVDRNNITGNYNAFVLSLKDVETHLASGATWSIFDSYVSPPNSYGSVKLEVGELHSAVDNPLTINYRSRSGGSNSANNQVITFSKANPDLLGGITFNALQSNSIRLVVEVGASNALGTGDVILTRDANATGNIELSIGFTAGSNTVHDANIDVGNQMLRLAAATNTKATLNGDLTGTGKLAVRDNTNGYYTIGTGTVVFAGDNTLSGDIEIGISNRAGNMQVDGTWTGAGNIIMGKGMLSGIGTLGMAADKTFTTTLHATQANHPSAIAPGTDGTIGTLTLGTASNNNVFTLQGASNTQTNELSLLVDIGGNASDTLVLHGSLTIGDYTRLVFKELSELTASSYTLMTYGSRTGTFASVYYGDDLIDDPTVPGSIAGQYHLVYGDTAITLVPEPAALSLLALGAIPMMRRRR